MRKISQGIRIALCLISAATLYVAGCDRVTWLHRRVPNPIPAYDVSRDGREIVYADQAGQLNFVDPVTKSHRRLHILPENFIACPALSPDGHYLVFASREKRNGWFHLFAYDLRARSLRRITELESNDTLPTFTSDSRTVIFARSEPDDRLTGPLIQSMLIVDPELRSFYSVDIETGALRRISGQTFQEISRPFIDQDRLYFSAWNCIGAPQNFFSMNLESGACTNPGVGIFGKGAEPVPLSEANHLTIVADGETPYISQVNVAPDGRLWRPDSQRMDKVGPACVQPMWNPADRKQLFFLAYDEAAQGDRYTLWRTDGDVILFDKIL